MVAREPDGPSKPPKSYNDFYDLVAEALEQHAESKQLNKDLVLMNTREEVIQNKIAKFCRERIRTAILFSSFIKDREIARECKNLLLLDVDSLALTSRAGINGDVLRAVLELAKAGEAKEAIEDIKETGLGKVKKALLSSRKEKEEN